MRYREIAQISKEFLDAFWQQFGGWKDHGGYSAFTKGHKLAELQRMAEVKIPLLDQPEKRRALFLAHKNVFCRLRGSSKCFACGAKGWQRHHIILLRNGGINARINLVRLCSECHSIIHPWMEVQPTRPEKEKPKRKRTRSTVRAHRAALYAEFVASRKAGHLSNRAI